MPKPDPNVVRCGRCLAYDENFRNCHRHPPSGNSLRGHVSEWDWCMEFLPRDTKLPLQPETNTVLQRVARKVDLD